MYKNIDFTKNGGFPVTQDTLAFMQEGYNETITALAATYGQYVILSGVEDLGTNYSDGWIIYNGELVKFIGGVKTARVAIEETTADETFGDDSVNTVYYTRVAKCVTVGGVLFSEFSRVKYRETVIASSGPLGIFNLTFIRVGNIVHVQTSHTSDTGPGDVTDIIPIWARPTTTLTFKCYSSYVDQGFVIFRPNGTITLQNNASTGHEITASYLLQ